MARPNGLREDALNLVVDPAMAMVMEFDGTLDDWDMVFRNIGEDVALRDHGFSSTINPDDRLSDHQLINKRKLHQLDESHEYMFSSSFLNSFSGEIAHIDDPSSSAVMNNNVIFDLDFDEPIGLGEEMERDLEEAWNMKFDHEKQPPNSFAESYLWLFPIFHTLTLFPDFSLPNINFGDVMDVFDEPFGPDVAFNIDAFQDKIEINDPGTLDNEKITTPHVNLQELGKIVQYTSPPFDAAGHSILSNQPPVNSTGSPENVPVRKGPKATDLKRQKKRVTLMDPKTELTDDQLKFQRFNYPIEMARLRREIEQTRKIKEGKRRLEAELWIAPADFAAPELVQLWNQRVVYPVKAREAAWRRELEELENLPKKRRLQKNEATGISERVIGNTPQLEAHDVVMQDGADFANFDMNAVNGDVDWDPGQPRHAPSRPSSVVGSSLLGRGALQISQGEHVGNIMFPWDNAGLSSSNAPIPGSVGRSDYTFSFDSTTVRVRRGSSKGSARDSPTIEFRDEAIGLEIAGQEGEYFPVVGETQESENMVVLERNSLNFLGYARMHMASDSGPLFFANIVPVESSSARIASEGFYHCLGLNSIGAERSIWSH
ncbi:hypothetical protein BU17DRAFT_66681 [Hysterangium stoloniferum]|nr:hypothetical protein BU17DRAFT_66681 [Hysterangium stoloniferum]